MVSGTTKEDNMDNLLEELEHGIGRMIAWADAIALGKRAARRIRELEERVRLYETGQLTGPTYLAEQVRQERFDG